MRVVVQRVSRASVTSGGELLGGIGRGLLVFAGFGHGDDSAAVAWMAEKIVKLRIFEDEAGKMNRSVADVGGGSWSFRSSPCTGTHRKGTVLASTRPPGRRGRSPCSGKCLRFLRDGPPCPWSPACSGPRWRWNW